MELRHGLSRVIRQARPQVVITQSPHINLASVYGSHADHVATGQGVWAAVYPDARNPFAFPELLISGFEPWSVDEIWIMNHQDANGAVDITRQIERKIRALRCHHSQHRDPDALEQRVRGGSARTLSRPGCPKVRRPSASTLSTPADARLGDSLPGTEPTSMPRALFEDFLNDQGFEVMTSDLSSDEGRFFVMAGERSVLRPTSRCRPKWSPTMPPAT